MITEDIRKYELETDCELKLAKITPKQMAKDFIQKNSAMGASVIEYFEIFRELKKQKFFLSPKMNKVKIKMIEEDIANHKKETGIELALNLPLGPHEMAEQFIKKKPSLGVKLKDYNEVFYSVIQRERQEYLQDLETDWQKHKSDKVEVVNKKALVGKNNRKDPEIKSKT